MPGINATPKKHHAGMDQYYFDLSGSIEPGNGNVVLMVRIHSILIKASDGIPQSNFRVQQD